MTVGQLIEELKKYSLDKVLVIYGDGPEGKWLRSTVKIVESKVVELDANIYIHTTGKNKHLKTISALEIK